MLKKLVLVLSMFSLAGYGAVEISNVKAKQRYPWNGKVDIDCEIAIDLTPDYSHDDLKNKFNNDFQEKGKTQIKNYLKQYLTNNFVEFLLNRVNITPDTQLSRINKKEKNRLIDYLKRFTFEIIDFNKDLAKITIGGVDLTNINPKTMESKITPNLYFAGEILDLDGPTGGYNLKIAFSTGYLAGKSASDD